MLSHARASKRMKIIGFVQRDKQGNPLLADDGTIKANVHYIKVSKSALAEYERLEKESPFTYNPLEKLHESDAQIIGLLNINSLKTKMDDLQRFIENKKIDILCLTETCTNDYRQLQIDGYENRSASSPHGCAIYSVLPIEHSFPCVVSHIETLAVVMKSSLYVCVYIPPATAWETVRSFFQDMLQECSGPLKEK